MKTLFLIITFVKLGSLSPFYNLDATDIQGSKVTQESTSLKSLTFCHVSVTSLGLGWVKIKSEIYHTHLFITNIIL